MIHETSIFAAGSRGSRSGSALACSLVLLLTLSGCGGGGGGGGSSAPTYSVGGTVTGLAGTGLVLRNNGANSLAVTANGAFTFSTALTSGAAYAVTVLTQPSGPAQICSVTNGSGTIGANVSNVAVTCVAAPTYTVGGTVTGLTGTGLVLRNNGADDLSVGATGAFVFGTALLSGSNYAVTVFAQPTGQTCTVANATGAVAGAAVTNITVNCLVASTWTGIRQFGSNVNDSAAVLAVDPTGGVVVGGDAGGAIAGSQGAAPGRYVAKYDATGARLWLYFFPGALSAINGVGVDAAGNVYVAGTFTGALGGTGTDGAVVFKLTVGAAPGYSVSIDWQREFGTANVDIATGFAVDANGNGAVVGYSVNGTSDDGFLQRFTSTGVLVPAAAPIPIDVPAGHVRARAVAFDTNGYFIVGDTTTSIEPGQTGTMFLRRYTSGATYVGTTQFDLGVPASIAIGAGTRLHVSGTVGTVGTASADGYLGSFDRNTGAENAAARKVFASVGGIEEGRGVGTAGNGDVYVTGQTQAGINGQSTGGVPNAYVVKLDADQNILWTQHLGGSVTAAGRAVGVLPTFGAFVAGTTGGSLPGSTTAGQNDAFIALYDAAGNLR